MEDVFGPEREAMCILSLPLARTGTQISGVVSVSGAPHVDSFMP